MRRALWQTIFKSYLNYIQTIFKVYIFGVPQTIFHRLAHTTQYFIVVDHLVALHTPLGRGSADSVGAPLSVSSLSSSMAALVSAWMGPARSVSTLDRCHGVGEDGSPPSSPVFHRRFS